MTSILSKLFKKPDATPTVAEPAPAPVIATQANDTGALPAPKPAKAAKAKSVPKAAPKARSAAATAGEGVAHKMRETVVAEPAITFEDAAQKIGAPEAKRGGHAWNVYSEAKRVMEIVQARAARS